MSDKFLALKAVGSVLLLLIGIDEGTETFLNLSLKRFKLPFKSPQ